MNTIRFETRRNIFDGLNLENLFYCGNLDDLAFLSRLYNLSSFPSFDSRFKNAEQDIWQHCINNDDYEANWVFEDERFQLLTCEDSIFLKFLSETVHPIVRPDSEVSQRMVEHYNDQLKSSGWLLVPKEKIAGRAKYAIERIGTFHSKISRAYTSADILSSNWMQTEITRIQDAIETDPALAIGTAKDLVESCCKAILSEYGVTTGKTDDLATLSKSMCKVLELVPEGISKEAKGAEIIRRTLSNLAALTKSIAELRGLYGSGHGKDGEHVGLEPRHARLCASCAITFVDFVTETFVKRGAKTKDNS